MPACHAGDRRFESGRVRQTPRFAPSRRRRLDGSVSVATPPAPERDTLGRMTPADPLDTSAVRSTPRPPAAEVPPPAPRFDVSRLVVLAFAVMFAIGALGFLASVLNANERRASPSPSPTDSAAGLPWLSRSGVPGCVSLQRHRHHPPSTDLRPAWRQQARRRQPIAPRRRCRSRAPRRAGSVPASSPEPSTPRCASASHRPGGLPRPGQASRVRGIVRSGDRV